MVCHYDQHLNLYAFFAIHFYSLDYVYAAFFWKYRFNTVVSIGINFKTQRERKIERERKNSSKESVCV